ncbi:MULTISPECIES: TetR/AcrR family transcriptional regulator [Glycomyces]|uniref:TetR family transcriptional regulator n=1 Tax=Glycomyces artemisiae TaxID=1076443 RepID=A0A2T0UHA1_9ACTN|nr:TetR/AcrR family transcriptional regulator [Glycomyces artemisiae]NUQ87837.1 TetR/AcrR family transcriptional regulator [Glycomyces artemisiae]PRY57207.1 TetR family transcriptional regulator [Glycomyces artemisiae]
MTKDEPSTRDRILNALQRILVEEGASGVTLEKVAAEAGVSKGGLLYHFKSKSDLYDGLARRHRLQEEANIARARETGVVASFLEVSWVESEESAAGLWALLTALRGTGELSEEARADVLFIFNGWRDLIHEQVADPVTAEIVRLVGDGLFLSALAGAPLPKREVVEQILARLTLESGGA